MIHFSVIPTVPHCLQKGIASQNYILCNSFSVITRFKEDTRAGCSALLLQAKITQYELQSSYLSINVSVKVIYQTSSIALSLDASDKVCNKYQDLYILLTEDSWKA